MEHFPPISLSAQAVRMASPEVDAEAGKHSLDFGIADIVMLLLTISVVIRVLNFHFFHIPPSVATAFGSILMTLTLLLLSYVPKLGVGNIVESFRNLLKNFPDLLMHYMLGFLLFAAAVEVDLRNLKRIMSTVFTLSVISTILSTIMVGVLAYFLMQNIAPMEFGWCLLFGAITSPTDPITVISILHDKPDLLPSSIKYFLVGESMLNDAVGVVLYGVMLEIVEKPDIHFLDIITLIFKNVVVECLYGALIGIFLAWIAYSAIVSVKDPLLEIVISFVLVGNINMICRILHASIPLASVAAGLFIGNYAVTFAMQHETTETFHEMWKLADETLNSILFLMIGAADLLWDPQNIGVGRALTLVVCTISISLIARLVAVAMPLLAIIVIEKVTGKRLRHESVKYRGGTIAVLIWAGMRGGISIALALGVPDSFVNHAIPGHMTYGQLIFFMTFILVVFSVVVQGLLFEPVVRMINRVSYKITPSGGLGTYASTVSLGNNEYDYSDKSGEDSVMSGADALWEAQNIYNDYDADPTDRTPLLPSEGPVSYVTDNVRFRPNEEGVPHTMSLNEYGRGGAPPVDHAHDRQGSVTFQNLGELGKIQSIPEFMQTVREAGGLRGWLDSRARARFAANDPADSSGALRRSRTEPEHLSSARVDNGSAVRQPPLPNRPRPPTDKN